MTDNFVLLLCVLQIIDWYLYAVFIDVIEDCITVS